jgi:toxin ParE1/3/4
VRYRLHPEARRDLRDAAQFYADRADNALAQTFLAEFERAIGVLLRHPELGAATLGGRRRHVMRRFPYAIIYAALDDELLVLAVAHHSRSPGYWQDRE